MVLVRGKISALAALTKTAVRKRALSEVRQTDILRLVLPKDGLVGLIPTRCFS